LPFVLISSFDSSHHRYHSACQEQDTTENIESASVAVVSMTAVEDTLNSSFTIKAGLVNTISFGDAVFEKLFDVAFFIVVDLAASIFVGMACFSCCSTPFP